MSRSLPLVCLGLLACGPAFAQNPTVSLSSSTTPYTQNFDTLRQSNAGQPTSTTINGVLVRMDQTPFTTVTPPDALVGWRYRRGTSDQFRRGTGSDSQGQGYSFGTEFGSGEAALGVLTSGTNTGTYFGVIVRNDTGATIDAVTITYAGEQWRYGGRATPAPLPDRLDFGYLLGSNELFGQNAGVPVPELNFESRVTSGTVGALNGNLAANRQVLTHTITFGGAGWAPGTDLALRWFDFDVAGADDGLAIDDFQIAVAPIPEPTGILLACGAAAGAIGLRRRVRRP